MQFDPDSPGIVKFANDAAGLTTAPEFQCQVTSVALTPAAQTEALAATLCRAESDLAKPSKWTLDLEILQDWTDPAGVSFYLYDADGLTKFFSVSYSGTVAPIATGECSIVSAAFLGAASGPLAGTASLPCIGKPAITKPTGTAVATGATAGTPGTWTPGGSRPPNNMTEMSALTASPATAWTTGQYVAALGEEYYWNGTDWALGRA
jgi:hypothetical protein